MKLNILKRAKDELNWLYHEPPFQTTTGKTDSGWFCREHAFHTYFLCASLGQRAAIALGNFCIISPTAKVNISIDKLDTHAWCITDSICPLDLSISFAHTPEFGMLPNPIIGVGKNGDYNIRYYKDPNAFADSIQNENNLGTCSYLQHSLFPVKPEALMRNPFSFLLPGRRAGSMTWGDLYGLDIYAKISLHIYKIATGQAQSLSCEAKGGKPVEWICSHYSAAIPKMMNILTTQHSA